MNFIFNNAFRLCARKSDVPLTQQGGDVSFGYLGLGLEFVLKLAQPPGSEAELGLRRGQRNGRDEFVESWGR